MKKHKHKWRLPDGIEEKVPDDADYFICDCGELKKLPRQTNESIN